MVRVRLAATGILAVLLATGLAGCSGGPNNAAPGEGDLQYKYAEGTGNETHGHVEGVVLTEAGNPVPGARVIILTYDRSAVADARGHFNFTGVAVGQHDVRVEKSGYKTLQRPITVVAGKLIQLEVILARANGLDGDFDHFHDHWRGQTLYTIFEGSVDFEKDVTKPPDCPCAIGWGLVPEPGRIVPPGTAKLTIDIAFEPGPMFEQEDMSFTLVPPPSPAGEQLGAQTWEITSGKEHFEFELPAPDIVDFGHAKYSNWKFFLYDQTWARSQVWDSAYHLLFKTPVDITIVAHKGDLMIDPPHPRYWDQGDSLAMRMSAPSSAQCVVPSDSGVGCNGRRANPTIRQTAVDAAVCFPGCMVFTREGLVPPGATRVTFDLELWYGGGNAEAWALAGPTDWVWGYKPASAPTLGVTWADYIWVEPVGTFEPPAPQGHGAEGRHYEIFIEQGQEDAFYTIYSQWIFMMGVRGHEDADHWGHMSCSVSVCGTPYFEMKNVRVHNDAIAEGDP